jgi:hypothetical protein
MSKAKRRDELFKNCEKNIGRFVNHFHLIITSVHGKNTKNEDFIALKDKFEVLKNANPSFIIEKAGPYIWKYKEQISGNNVAFFLNSNFEDDIKEAQNENSIAEVSPYENIVMLMNQLKRTWHSFIPEEQNTIIKHTRAMLKYYAGYLQDRKMMKNEGFDY